MASPTKRTKVRKALTKAKQGKARKNKVAILGSTAKDLPLTAPNANEQKQAKTKAAAKKTKA